MSWPGGPAGRACRVHGDEHQIFTTGQRWWAADHRAALFEAAMLSEKVELDQRTPDCWQILSNGAKYMTDDLLFNKAATIERCVARAREEYEANPDGFASDFTRQDAAILNIQRACEAALDMEHYLIRRERLGIPQSARDVFCLLQQGGWITQELAGVLKRMVGFRNIAVHDSASADRGQHHYPPTE